MREQSGKEEELFTESIVPPTTGVYDSLLGRESVPAGHAPMEVGRENGLGGGFIAPDSRPPEYDFRYIDSIYRRFTPALQLPV